MIMKNHIKQLNSKLYELNKLEEKFWAEKIAPFYEGEQELGARYEDYRAWSRRECRKENKKLYREFPCLLTMVAENYSPLHYLIGGF